LPAAGLCGLAPRLRDFNFCSDSLHRKDMRPMKAITGSE